MYQHPRDWHDDTGVIRQAKEQGMGVILTRPLTSGMFQQLMAEAFPEIDAGSSRGRRSCCSRLCSRTLTSRSLQNVMGLIRDPVANRVAAPCLGRNVMAASSALACANVALAGSDGAIPLDEVIEIMLRVGIGLPSALCCTALGGLSITSALKEIEQELNQRNNKEAREWNC